MPSSRWVGTVGLSKEVKSVVPLRVEGGGALWEWCQTAFIMRLRKPLYGARSSPLSERRHKHRQAIEQTCTIVGLLFDS
ncbi:hypothetical protein Trydic_g176 [Trypoxylus dichotomus]